MLVSRESGERDNVDTEAEGNAVSETAGFEPERDDECEGSRWPGLGCWSSANTEWDGWSGVRGGSGGGRSPSHDGDSVLCDSVMIEGWAIPARERTPLLGYL